MAHAPWQEPFLGAPPEPLAKLWDYLAERVREGRGGNAYSYEIEAFEVAHRSHIAPLVTARAAQIVVATHGPFGETAGTILFHDSADVGAVLMPFLLLPDDRGHQALVATALAKPGEVHVRREHGLPVAAIGFESVEHWQ